MFACYNFCMADPDIEQLKALIRQNIAVSQETQRMVRGMRSAGRIRSFLWLALVLGSAAISAYFYYYYVEPRVLQIENIYHTTISPLQGMENGVSGLISKFNNKPASTTPAQ